MGGFYPIFKISLQKVLLMTMAILQLLMIQLNFNLHRIALKIKNALQMIRVIG
jgi:hypothetical protein